MLIINKRDQKKRVTQLQGESSSCNLSVAYFSWSNHRWVDVRLYKYSRVCLQFVTNWYNVNFTLRTTDIFDFFIDILSVEGLTTARSDKFHFRQGIWEYESHIALAFKPRVRSPGSLTSYSLVWASQEKRLFLYTF